MDNYDGVLVGVQAVIILALLGERGVGRGTGNLTRRPTGSDCVCLAAARRSLVISGERVRARLEHLARINFWRESRASSGRQRHERTLDGGTRSPECVFSHDFRVFWKQSTRAYSMAGNEPCARARTHA